MNTTGTYTTNVTIPCKLSIFVYIINNMHKYRSSVFIIQSEYDMQKGIALQWNKKNASLFIWQKATIMIYPNKCKFEYIR